MREIQQLRNGYIGFRLVALNLLDALRSYDKDTELKEALGAEFSNAYLKLKTMEWNSYAAHFTEWERENTLNI